MRLRIGLRLEIFDYFQIVPSSLLHAGRGQNRAHSPRCSSLLADHFAQVGLVNAEFQDGRLFAINLSHNDLVGIVNQRFADRFN
jgi:hypothetical protein